MSLLFCLGCERNRQIASPLSAGRRDVSLHSLPQHLSSQQVVELRGTMCVDISIDSISMHAAHHVQRENFDLWRYLAQGIRAGHGESEGNES